MSLRSSE